MRRVAFLLWSLLLLGIPYLIRALTPKKHLPYCEMRKTPPVKQSGVSLT